MDGLEDATATLLKNLEELSKRLECVCRKPNPAEMETKGELKQGSDERVLLAVTLCTFSERVAAANRLISSILERLEL